MTSFRLQLLDSAIAVDVEAVFRLAKNMNFFEWLMITDDLLLILQKRAMIASAKPLQLTGSTCGSISRARS